MFSKEMVFCSVIKQLYSVCVRAGMCVCVCLKKINRFKRIHNLFVKHYAFVGHRVKAKATTRSESESTGIGTSISIPDINTALCSNSRTGFKTVCPNHSNRGPTVSQKSLMYKQ